MSPTRSILLAAVLGVGLCAPGLGASAATKADKMTEGRSAMLQAVADCRKLTEDAPRLACFDKAVAELDQAEAKGQLVVVDREQVKAVRRQAFGFSLPSMNLFNRRAPKEDEIDHVTIELANANKSPDGHWRFTSTEGVVWVQIDEEPINDDPHPGSKMAIRKAALGSYFCNVDGQRAVRCERRR